MGKFRVDIDGAFRSSVYTSSPLDAIGCMLDIDNMDLLKRDVVFSNPKGAKVFVGRERFECKAIRITNKEDN